MCCTAIQETRIPSEMCAEETCITDGKHASLLPSDIIMCGETRILRDMCAGNTIPRFFLVLYGELTPLPYKTYPEISGYVCVLIESLIYIEIQW